MINFIKKAVESVEGIKSFLFNTDYRNNFSLGNVDYPCCVLTPIMNTKYDLNNFIHESAELQVSIIDTAPYEYTGDDLYSINKRCSDLLLQVIANLQVKTKFNKELTFEFILPSGDELVSGVMCNITATMKQGSCIGAPSYVEVVVQPIVRKSITTNGTYHITPSSGFNAMREVEVDVRIEEKADPKLQSKAVLITTNNSNTNVVADEGFDGLGNVDIAVQIPTEERSVDITRNGEVEILPTSADAMTKVTANVQVPPPPLEEKQVTITKAKTTEIITPDVEYGLSRVEVITDIPLESKQVTINENGTTTIEASEGFEGIERVNIEVIVPTIALKTLNKEILENGEFEFLPNNGEAFDKVKIKINVTMDIIDDLLSNRTDACLSANQGRILNNKKAEKIVVINQTSNIVEIQPNVLNVWGEVVNLTITLVTPTDESIVNEYMIQFTSGATATTLVLPDTIQWLSEPTINPNATYQLSIVNNLAIIGGFNL